MTNPYDVWRTRNRECAAEMPGPPGPAPPLLARGESTEAPHADREIARFLRVSRPYPDGRGWYDPTASRGALVIASSPLPKRAKSTAKPG